MLEFDLELARLEPEEFAEAVLRRSGPRSWSRVTTFRFGHGRAGDLALLERLGFDVRPVPLVDGVSSSADPRAARAPASSTRAATLLGRPPEVEGIVVDGRRTRTGRSASRPRTSPSTASLLVPASASTQAPRSGTGPRSRSAPIRTTEARSGASRRYLLDFEGDLYGRRLVFELWRRLRDERAFESEAELVEADRPGRRPDEARRPARAES